MVLVEVGGDLKETDNRLSQRLQLSVFVPVEYSRYKKKPETELTVSQACFQTPPPPHSPPSSKGKEGEWCGSTHQGTFVFSVSNAYVILVFRVAFMSFFEERSMRDRCYQSPRRFSVCYYLNSVVAIQRGISSSVFQLRLEHGQ